MRAPNNLNALRAFESVARHLSYVRAASELNVTPAAVGQLVRGLEETLGVTLFHRAQSGPARLELTEVGRAAIPDLQAGFDRLSAAVERLKAGTARNAFTVTVPAGFADKWLLSRLERFQAQYPEYELRLDTNDQIVDFSTGRVDVGIRYGAGQWQGMNATWLLSDDFFPVCSPALLAANPSLNSVSGLRHHPLIHDVSMRYDPIFPTWRTWLISVGIDDIDAERGLQINDSAAVIQAAIAGSGVALGRSVLVANDLAAGRLVRPCGDALTCAFSYYIVHTEEASSLSAVLAFKEWLLTEASAL